MKNLKIIATRTKEKTNKGYEVEWYDKEGNASYYVQVKTLEDLGLYLARCCWGQIRFDNNPTIYKDGERFCFAENPLEIKWTKDCFK